MIDIPKPQSNDRRDFVTRSLALAMCGAAWSRTTSVFSQEEPKDSDAAQAGASGSAVHSDGMQWPPGWVGDEQILMLIYPGFTALDLFGPHHMFALMMGAKVHLVAKNLDPVKSDTGIEVRPTIAFADCPARAKVLFVPGGTVGTIQAAVDPETLDFVKDRGSNADYITSVCTGSIVLGFAGLLVGYRATSHWITRDLLTEFGAIPIDERVVVDRNRITGAGVTSGLDFGLKLVQELRNQQYAEAVQLFAEYDPQPPIDKGSQSKASPDISGLLLQMHEPFR